MAAAITFLLLWFLVNLHSFARADQQLYGTTVWFYSDDECKVKAGGFIPNSKELARASACRQLEPPRHSFNIPELEPECLVTIYSDTACAVNAINVPKGQCVSADEISSWSLYCGDPAQDPPSSTLPIEPFSKQTASPAASTASKPNPSSISASTSSSASPPADATQSTQPAPAASPNNNDSGGISTAATIAIGVILPTVSIIVAIIFGVRMWNNGHVKKKHQQDDNNNNFHEIPLNDQNPHLPPPPTNPSYAPAAAATAPGYPIPMDKISDDGFVATPVTPISPAAADFIRQEATTHPHGGNGYGYVSPMSPHHNPFADSAAAEMRLPVGVHELSGGYGGGDGGDGGYGGGGGYGNGHGYSNGYGRDQSDVSSPQGFVELPTHAPRTTTTTTRRGGGGYPNY